MGNCDSCPSKGTCQTKKEDCNGVESSKLQPRFGRIKNVIGVISGKGGVGKSTVTGIMAAMLAKRGYKVNGVLKQIFVDTNWGELDYLLIDMPPGTGDIALTVMQEFPINELVIVSTPQDMVSMIVKKVVIMANKIGVKIKGVVENMAYINCPDCDKKIRVFSNKSSEENAEYLGIPLIGELPIDINLTDALAQGKLEEYVKEDPLYSLIFEGLY